MSSEKKSTLWDILTLEDETPHSVSNCQEPITQWYSATFLKNRYVKAFVFYCELYQHMPRVTEVCHGECQSGWLAGILQIFQRYMLYGMQARRSFMFLYDSFI